MRPMSTPPADPPPGRGHLLAEFSAALRERMAEREVGCEGLARAIGVTRQAVVAYRRGANLPTTATAFRISEALDYLPLYGIVLRGRRTECDHCGRPLVSNGSAYTRRWCNSICRDRARRGGPPAVTAEQRAIGKRCGQCEPRGVCYDGRCALRPFSPLPLAVDAITPLARRSHDLRRASWTPERRKAQSERARRQFAGRRVA